MLGIAALDVGPDPVRISTEGALWGALAARGVLDGTVIVSDGAGQFDVGHHALCWIHAERLVHKLEAFTEDRRLAKEAIRDRIWGLYADLKSYACAPTPAAKAELSERFEAIFQLKRLHAKKAELLAVLERTDVPLHTNGSENDIRAHVPMSPGARSPAAPAPTPAATAATPSSA